jgi:modulator of FtsH protease HflC
MNIIFKFILIFLILFILSKSIFFVNYNQKCIKLQFGEIIQVINEPGIYLKIPFIQSYKIIKFKQTNSIKNLRMLTSEKKEVIIKIFYKYTIKDPVKFFFSFNNDLNSSIESILREKIGKYTIQDIFVNKNQIEQDVINDFNNKESSNGVLLDQGNFLITKISFPDQVLNSIYRRMIAERQRDSIGIRSEGEEHRIKIIADADREVQITLAQAEKNSQEIKNEGDRIANSILKETYQKNEKMYLFLKAMKIYKDSIVDKKIILNSESDFLKYFNLDKQ